MKTDETTKEKMIAISKRPCVEAMHTWTLVPQVKNRI